MPRALLACLALAAPAAALAGEASGTCDTAIVFAIDVSNSVVPAEYALQVEGLADALRDEEVAAALADGDVAVAVMQWSGVDAQAVSVAWTAVATPADALLLSARVRAIPRAFEYSDTAPAEALGRALDLLAAAPPCGRQVVDVSGDGKRNRGGDVAAMRDAAAAAGVTVNAIAIEITNEDVGDFFASELVTPDGFVMRARGHADYPRAIRAKILRELAPPVG